MGSGVKGILLGETSVMFISVNWPTYCLWRRARALLEGSTREKSIKRSTKDYFVQVFSVPLHVIVWSSSCETHMTLHTTQSN